MQGLWRGPGSRGWYSPERSSAPGCGSAAGVVGRSCLSLVGELAGLGQEGIQPRVVEILVSDQHREQVLLGSKGGLGIQVGDRTVPEEFADEAFGIMGSTGWAHSPSCAQTSPT